jgi:DNA-binding NarL/FixJ family response regulator
MRVLLADEHATVLWALRTVIREQPGLTLVGEVLDMDSLLVHAQTLQPDLILLEWESLASPAACTLSVLRQLEFHPRVLVLSRKPESRQAALQAGADAFVSKADAPESLLAALRRLVSR